MGKLIKTTTVLVFLCHGLTSAQESASIKKRTYATKPITNAETPVIDGKLNEVAWDIVEWQDSFTEYSPNNNTPPSEQTRFKIIYDEKYIYIGIQALDKHPDSIVKRLGRHDTYDGDLIEVHIDSNHDLRSGFSFMVSAAGVRGDEFISENGSNWDGSWNPIWTAKSSIDEQGWACEMKIPLSQLRFSNALDQVWGLQVMRKIYRKDERSIWQPTPNEAPGWVSEFGEIIGLKGLSPQKQLEIQPFVVTQLETYPVELGNPFRDGNDFKVNGGLDAKVGITNDLTLDLTVNPDFGQVEADPSVIQLDGFQTYFVEHRPFFVENKNIFNFQISSTVSGGTLGSDNIFYSRRIGRSPQVSPDVPSSAYTDQPKNTTILGATKFSGKTKKGWSIGILEAITSKEYAHIEDNGQRSKQLVEPFTNYFVGRLQKDFNDNSSFIGGMFTATNRNLGNTLDILHKSAYVGGLDFMHQWKNRSWYVLGDIAMSYVSGSEAAIANTQKSIGHLFNRVDAGHVELDDTRTSLTGTGGNIQLGKPGDKFKFEGGLSWRSPELEINDLGYQNRADDLRQNLWMGYRFFKPFSIFRNLNLDYRHWVVWDFGGKHNSLQWNISADMQFKNYWGLGAGVKLRPLHFSNYALRGGPRLNQSHGFGGHIWIDSDKRKNLAFFPYASYFNNDVAKTSLFELLVQYKPTNAFNISIAPEFSKNNDQLQYVENIETPNLIRYINATIHQKTLSASIRLNYAVNPNLTVQYYGQPFISRGRYFDFKYITNATANHVEDRFYLLEKDQIAYNSTEAKYLVDEDHDGITDYEFGNPDFSFVQFRSNLVLRWEYVPGSEIFLVWSQGITSLEDSSESLFKGLKSGILNKRPENIFLLKVTYRLLK